MEHAANTTYPKSQITQQAMLSEPTSSHLNTALPDPVPPTSSTEHTSSAPTITTTSTFASPSSSHPADPSSQTPSNLQGRVPIPSHTLSATEQPLQSAAASASPPFLAPPLYAPSEPQQHPLGQEQRRAEQAPAEEAAKGTPTTGPSAMHYVRDHPPSGVSAPPSGTLSATSSSQPASREGKVGEVQGESAERLEKARKGGNDGLHECPSTKTSSFQSPWLPPSQGSAEEHRDGEEEIQQQEQQQQSSHKNQGQAHQGHQPASSVQLLPQRQEEGQKGGDAQHRHAPGEEGGGRRAEGQGGEGAMRAPLSQQRDPLDLSAPEEVLTTSCLAPRFAVNDLVSPLLICTKLYR